MQIIRFEAENIKKLKAVTIVPKEGENIIFISGQNETGKSSVLDSIWLALGGAAAAKGIKRVIRDGETKAHVTLDLGKYIVKRWWTSNENSYLEVSTKDGAVFKGAQGILDGLIGNLSFDPAAFANMKEDKQKEMLQGLVKLDLDIDEWQKDRDRAYEERTIINREINNLQGQINGKAEAFPPTTPDIEVSISALVANMTEAQNEIAKNAETKRSVKQKEMHITGMRQSIERLEEELLQLLEAVEKKRKEISSLNFDHTRAVKEYQEMAKIADALVDPDVKEIQEKIRLAETVNKNVAAKKEFAEFCRRYEAKKVASAALTKEITELDEAKTEAVLRAVFPIQGLGFDQTGVTYKGIPFGQCSSEERLRVSLAMAIAMNPKLRILRVTDGSLIDGKHMKIIEEMCRENDYQLWIERIAEEPSPGSIYIYDGEIVSQEIGPETGVADIGSTEEF